MCNKSNSPIPRQIQHGTGLICLLIVCLWLAGSLTVDQLADLMLLADRYEVDSLKTACEHGLKAHIDHDSVLYFLSMGDQFNAKHLRVGNIKNYQYKQTANPML